MKQEIPSSYLAPRAANGQLQPGARLNPAGRPVGSGGGIASIAKLVFGFLDDPVLLAHVRAALREEAEEHPIRFARQFVLPCTPNKFRQELRARIAAAELSKFSTLSETGNP